MSMRPCNCGSGKDSWWEYDGYGIPLCRVCDDCEEKQMSKYRDDIHEHYDADEPIEPEDY